MLLLPLLAVTVSVADVVTLIPDATTKGATGGVIRGTVVSESPTKVEVRLGNSVTTIPTNEVVSISYDAHPSSLDQAQIKEAANALSDAAELYKRAATEASSKPFVAEDAAFGQARVTAEMALTDPAKTTEAITLLDVFARNHKTGRHIAPALESLARLQIARENYSAVEGTLTQLVALPKGDERALLLRIRILTRKGQHDQAIAELDKVIASAAEGSTKKRDAQLARAESLVALKKYTEAEAAISAVIKASGAEDAATLASAYNALGDSYRAAGNTRKAIEAYLHTDLLFSKEKDEHARALANLVPLWRELKRDDRAEETLERLKQEYPKSPLAAGK
jgi:tetratricopeptide (TPR) repeat protein